MSTSPYDRLFVIWREPSDDGRRHVIGELARTLKRMFVFRYVDDLATAKAAGFAPMLVFDDEAKVYESGYLFPTFAQRIPDPGRADRQRMFREWGVENDDDPMEALAKSGGMLMTDRLELAEYRAPDDRLERPLVMRVAGVKKHPGSADLIEGAPVELVRDLANSHDPNAVRLVTTNGASVGFVPRQYAPFVAALIDGGTPLDAIARRRLPDPDVAEGRWRVEIARAQVR